MFEHFRRYLLLNISIILGSFVLFGLAFYLLSQSLTGEAARILTDRTLIFQHSSDQENDSYLKANAAEAAIIHKKMDALLVSQDGLIGFPQFMQNLARTHSLGLTFNFDGGPVPPAAGAAGYVAFTAVAQGSPENIRDFTDELENKTTRFLVNLKQFVLTPDGGAYRVHLEGQVFFQ